MSSSIATQSSDDVYANLVKILGDYGIKPIVMGTGFFVSKEYDYYNLIPLTLSSKKCQDSRRMAVAEP